MLTADLARLGVGPGQRVLDVGCGQGRHAYEAYRRGAEVVALDRSDTDTSDTSAMLGAMRLAGESPPGARGVAVCADALSLPFPDESFDVVVAAEVLEHVPADGAAATELARVLRPGGSLAVTVPRWWPERVCWALTDDYHAPAVAGGHVRIYRRRQLRTLMSRAGLEHAGSHHAHALHSPYWWLRCAIGVDKHDARPVRAYHRFLVWDIERPHAAVRALERVLNPVMGKSLVVYFKREGRRC